MANLIGAKIRRLRLHFGYEQKELADKIGVTSQMISNWERGYTKTIEDRYIVKLSEVLETTGDFLLGKENAESKIRDAIIDDPDLLEFFNDLTQREELKLLFNQVKPLKKETIKRIIKYIKLVEDEEDKE